MADRGSAMRATEPPPTVSPDSPGFDIPAPLNFGSQGLAYDVAPGGGGPVLDPQTIGQLWPAFARN